MKSPGFWNLRFNHPCIVLISTQPKSPYLVQLPLLIYLTDVLYSLLNTSTRTFLCFYLNHLSLGCLTHSTCAPLLQTPDLSFLKFIPLPCGLNTCYQYSETKLHQSRCHRTGQLSSIEESPIVSWTRVNLQPLSLLDLYCLLKMKIHIACPNLQTSSGYFHGSKWD